MLLEKKEIFKIWTGFLAILTFILCLLGIFLTRSGILSSVHSFAIDASRGFFVIALITLIGGAGLLILGIKMPKIKSDDFNKNQIIFWSKIGSVLVNNYFLIIALFIVLLGTIYPIFSRSFFDQFIAIGPNYYNKIFSILIVPFLIFLAIAPKLDYNKKTTKEKILNRRNALILAASAAITSLTFFYHQDSDFLQIAILFLAIFAGLMTIFFDGNIRHSELVSGSKNISRPSRNITMAIAHFGFSLIIIGLVLTSSFGLVKEINLKEGESFKIGNYEIKFEKIEYSAGKNFVARQGDFLILENGKEIGQTKPQLRYYHASEQSTNESSIKHNFFGDIYTVIGNKDESENYAVRAYYKPFIYLIWIGCGMIFFAVIFGIKKNLMSC